jgi:hypothetical protein
MALPNLTYHLSTTYLKNREMMLALHKRVAGSVSPQLYDSLYLGDPYGDPLLGLCFDGVELVGQENYIRQNIVCGGRLYKAALGINTMVDPRYRLFHGIFGKLCQLTIEEMKSKVDVLCAFANEESKKYYLKYFQWKMASKIRVYKKVTKYSDLNFESILSFMRPGKCHKGLQLEKVVRFQSHVLDAILERYLDKSAHFYFHKTTGFLNWKFLDNRHYRVNGYYIWHKGTVVGYCVTYDHDRERRVLDILIDDNDIKLYEKVISYLSYMSRKDGIKRLAIYSTPNSWYEKALKRHFFLFRWDFDFITRTFRKPLPCKDWIIHIGDFDIF